MSECVCIYACMYDFVCMILYIIVCMYVPLHMCIDVGAYVRAPMYRTKAGKSQRTYLAPDRQNKERKFVEGKIRREQS